MSSIHRQNSGTHKIHLAPEASYESYTILTGLGLILIRSHNRRAIEGLILIGHFLLCIGRRCPTEGFLSIKNNAKQNNRRSFVLRKSIEVITSVEGPLEYILSIGYT